MQIESFNSQPHFVAITCISKHVATNRERNFKLFHLLSKYAKFIIALHKIAFITRRPGKSLCHYCVYKQNCQKPYGKESVQRNHHQTLPRAIAWDYHWPFLGESWCCDLFSTTEKKRNKTHTEKSKEKPAPRSTDIRELFRNHLQNVRANEKGHIAFDRTAMLINAD